MRAWRSLPLDTPPPLPLRQAAGLLPALRHRDARRLLLRWYAECCRTPIGNTPRNPKLSYVGLVHNCLATQALEPSFGPLRMVTSSMSATGEVRSTPASTAIGVLTVATALLGARLSGGYRDNPFFRPGTSAPIRDPYMLSRDERERAYRTAA